MKDTANGQASAPEISSPLSALEIKARVLSLAGPADQALQDNLKAHVDFIDQVSRYIIFSGGKRLRPVLYLAACSMLGQKPNPKQSSIFEFLARGHLTAR